MLGWHISVYRSTGVQFQAFNMEQAERQRIAVWQTGWSGLDWIEEILQSGNGHQFGASGYPNRYLIQARHVVPTLLSGPPHARSVWLREPGDVLNDKWVGKTLIDEVAARLCPDDEVLLVEAWDES